MGLPPELGRWEYLMDGEWVPFEVESYEVQNRDGEDATHNVLISNYGELERDELIWCLLSCWKGGFGPAILWVSLLVTLHRIFLSS